MQMQTIKLKDAIMRMRELSKANVPFLFGFITYSNALKTTNGYKTIEKAKVRAGYNQTQSEKHNILISFTDIESNEDRQFYLPLLSMFNNKKVIP